MGIRWELANQGRGSAGSTSGGAPLPGVGLEVLPDPSPNVYYIVPLVNTIAETRRIEEL